MNHAFIDATRCDSENSRWMNKISASSSRSSSKIILLPLSSLNVVASDSQKPDLPQNSRPSIQLLQNHHSPNSAILATTMINEYLFLINFHNFYGSRSLCPINQKWKKKSEREIKYDKKWRKVIEPRKYRRTKKTLSGKFFFINKFSLNQFNEQLKFNEAFSSPLCSLDERYWYDEKLFSSLLLYIE